MSQKMMNIMLIEDNDDHVELIRQTLEDKRVANSITHFADAESALFYLYASGTRQSEFRPGIILLDLNLPGMSGHEFLRKIKEHPDLKSIPVVVLTTSAGEVDRLMAYENSANSYLVKPIDFDQFERMIGDLGFYWGVWNAGPKADD